MALTDTNLKEWYKEIYVRQNTPMPIEMVSLINYLVRSKFNSRIFKQYIITGILMDSNDMVGLGWRDIIKAKRVNVFRELHEALFSDLEDLPLKINEKMFKETIKWRLIQGM